MLCMQHICIVYGIRGTQQTIHFYTSFRFEFPSSNFDDDVDGVVDEDDMVHV